MIDRIFHIKIYEHKIDGDLHEKLSLIEICSVKGELTSTNTDL